ncbi:MAG: MBL fold metallo-hydrolase [Thermodesulfobacteriota bacterium]|nr:MBL fold metallo-hydrolase [Thermodesulfobacteriota bacterium]
MSLEDVFNSKVPKGKVAIAWINSYSCVVIKTQTVTLVFDPVMLDPNKSFHADMIIITHEHDDHFAPGLLRKIHSRTNTPVLTSEFIAKRLEGIKTQTLNVGDRVIIKDIELYGMHCDHPANRPLSFLISASNGIRIYHPSDSKPFADMVFIRRDFNPDILLYSGNSLEAAAQIASIIEPCIALSYDSDAESKQRFLSLMNESSSVTQPKMIKKYEIYQYPEEFAHLREY